MLYLDAMKDKEAAAGDSGDEKGCPRVLRKRVGHQRYQEHVIFFPKPKGRAPKDHAWDPIHNEWYKMPRKAPRKSSPVKKTNPSKRKINPAKKARSSKGKPPSVSTPKRKSPPKLQRPTTRSVGTQKMFSGIPKQLLQQMDSLAMLHSPEQEPANKKSLPKTKKNTRKSNKDRKIRPTSIKLAKTTPTMFRKSKRLLMLNKDGTVTRPPGKAPKGYSWDQYAGVWMATDVETSPSKMYVPKRSTHKKKDTPYQKHKYLDARFRTITSKRVLPLAQRRFSIRTPPFVTSNSVVISVDG